MHSVPHNADTHSLADSQKQIAASKGSFEMDRDGIFSVRIIFCSFQLRLLRRIGIFYGIIDNVPLFWTYCRGSRSYLWAQIELAYILHKLCNYRGVACAASVAITSYYQLTLKIRSLPISRQRCNWQDHPDDYFIGHTHIYQHDFLLYNIRMICEGILISIHGRHNDTDF